MMMLEAGGWNDASDETLDRGRRDTILVSKPEDIAQATDILGPIENWRQLKSKIAQIQTASYVLDFDSKKRRTHLLAVSIGIVQAEDTLGVTRAEINKTMKLANEIGVELKALTKQFGL